MNKDKAIVFIKKKIAWHERELEKWQEVADAKKADDAVIRAQEVFTINGFHVFGETAFNAVNKHFENIENYKNIIELLEAK